MYYMAITVRKNVFETNSSSSHSLVIGFENNISGDNMFLKTNSKEIILLNTSPLFLKLNFSLINYN